MEAACICVLRIQCICIKHNGNEADYSCRVWTGIFWYNREKSENFILEVEWEPCCCISVAHISVTVVNVGVKVARGRYQAFTARGPDYQGYASVRHQDQVSGDPYPQEPWICINLVDASGLGWGEAGPRYRTPPPAW